MGERSLDSLLYASRLTKGVGLGTIGAIVRHARARNDREGIQGLLVFDGQSFVQLVDGPSEAIRGLRARLLADPRHFDFQELLFATNVRRSRFPGWQLGYLGVEDARLRMEQLRSLSGPVALETFETLIAGLDLGIADALPT